VGELAEIQSAREVIAGTLVRTPLLSAPQLGTALGCDLHFKCEMLQRTGSFKIRGVLNKLSTLTADERQRGVIGVSSGNHAQALAYGASLMGIESTIVMPADSVASKVAATRAYGGQVELTAENLLETYEARRVERGLTPVHPFNDKAIIAGAGTTGLELLEDLPDVDYVFVSIGGGGLISGVATAIKLSRPATKIIGVEPAGSAVVSRSIEAGQLVELEHSDTIADGLKPPFTGDLTVDRVRRFVDEVILVSDAEIIDAMRLIFEQVKVVAEPSAAASFAGLRSGQVKIPAGASVACVLSGGNISAARLQELL